MLRGLGAQSISGFQTLPGSEPGWPGDLEMTDSQQNESQSHSGDREGKQEGPNNQVGDTAPDPSGPTMDGLVPVLEHEVEEEQDARGDSVVQPEPTQMASNVPVDRDLRQSDELAPPVDPLPDPMELDEADLTSAIDRSTATGASLQGQRHEIHLLSARLADFSRYRDRRQPADSDKDSDPDHHNPGAKH